MHGHAPADVQGHAPGDVEHHAPDDVISALNNHRSSRQIILSLVLFAAVGASLIAAPGPEGLSGAFLAALMLAIATADSDRYIIPNELIAAALALGLLRAATLGPDADWRDAIWATLRAVSVALPLLGLMAGYRRWRGRDGLGLGDVKLAAVAGAWLGLVAIFAAIELATLSALGAYLVNAYLRKRPFTATAFVPFGLFLAPAIWIGWLVEILLG